MSHANLFQLVLDCQIYDSNNVVPRLTYEIQALSLIYEMHECDFYLDCLFEFVLKLFWQSVCDFTFYKNIISKV